MTSLFHALRCWHWPKNLLVFVPLVTSHHLFEFEYLQPAFLAFLSFSLLASAVYLLNDLKDIESDRLHPNKANRPIARGDLSPGAAMGIAVLLFAGALAISWLYVDAILPMLILYTGATTLYTFKLKQIPFLDTVILAILYTIRLLAGHVATGIAHSAWLTSFSFFIFFSLAMMKRYAELQSNEKKGEKWGLYGRGYELRDLPVVVSFGAGSGLLSILVLMLYTDSNAVQLLYGEPLILMLLAPLVILWIGRMWLMTSRQVLTDDPVMFTIRDPFSYLIMLLCGMVMFGAK